jgi:PAS domain S-box-containing protein
MSERAIPPGGGPSRPLPQEYTGLHTAVALYHAETARVIDANEPFLDLLGYPLGRLRRLGVDEYSANTYSSSGSAFRSRVAAAAAGDPEQFRWRIKRADGELRWVKFHLSAVELRGCQYTLAEVRDVTEETHNSRRVRLLSRVVRHNLRNQATVIAGNAETIRCGLDPGGTRERAERIREEAMEIGSLSGSVAQIERTITADATDYPPVRVRTVLAELVGEFESEYPNATVSVRERTEMWAPGGEPLRRALSELIENAIVHSECDPEVTLCVDSSPNTGRTEIRISDRCPRIPDMELGALDDGTDQTSTSHGSGIGLFVAKWSVEALGGEMKIERSDSRGNTVSLYLPPKEPTQ